MRTISRSLTLPCLLLLSLSIPLWGQRPLDACELFRNPEKYADSFIEVKGVVYSGFEEFVLTGSECEKFSFAAIWLAYPGEPQVKDDPQLHAVDLKFQRTKQAKVLDRLLSQKGCANARASAVLSGFFQYRKDTLIKSNSSTAIVGFGHMGMYHYRLVIQSVESAEPLACAGSKKEQSGPK